MRTVSLLLLWCFWGADVSRATDLGKIDRALAKEPKYLCQQPLYGLFVFGPKAQTRVWAVLDKSAEAAASYDILYFDRAASGDLTVPAHKIPLKDGKFDIGDFTDPITKDKHTELHVTLVERRGNVSPDVRLHVRWQGSKTVLGGGYPEESGDYMKFATDRAKAPILWVYGGGDFRFQRWYSETLTIGEATDFRVFLGQQGFGRSTFCAIMHPFLPDDVPVLATLRYADMEGREKHLDSKLKERC
jgi:hypothetical protein